MSQVISTIRPAPGGDGPFFVVTEKDGVVTNLTPAVTTLALAVNQARDDQGTALTGLTVEIVRVITSAS
jgi:hypothetical protein